MRTAAVVLLVSALGVAPEPCALAAQQAPRGTDPLPPPEELSRRLRASLRLDYEVLKDFTYLEERRDVKISRLGKVTIGPRRTFEVYPSEKPGGTYKRLIAIEGTPLPREELARRDAERARDLEQGAARERSETAGERERRLQQYEEERRRQQALLADAVAVFEPTLAGRESIDGHPVLAIDLKPRDGAPVTTREGRWMKRFAGRLWVAEADYQIVKLDMRAFEDITIGWGVVGRLHAGSRLFLTRRRVEDVWLPATMTYEASGRTLLFRPFSFSVTTYYSGYRRTKQPGSAAS